MNTNFKQQLHISTATKMQLRALALGMLIIFIEIYNLSLKEGDAENSSALEQNDLQKYLMD